MDYRHATAESLLHLLLVEFEHLERHPRWTYLKLADTSLAESLAQLRDSALASLHHITAGKPVSNDALGKTIHNARLGLRCLGEVFGRLEHDLPPPPRQGGIIS